MRSVGRLGQAKKVGAGETVIGEAHLVKLHMAQNILRHFQVPPAMKLDFYTAATSHLSGAPLWTRPA